MLLDAFGEVVVSDFGISSRLESSLSHIMPTSIKGTPGYMPPGQQPPHRSVSQTTTLDYRILLDSR